MKLGTTTLEELKALLEEIATADGFAQPDQMNENVVKVSKIGWSRILKYAHALKSKEPA